MKGELLFCLICPKSEQSLIWFDIMLGVCKKYNAVVFDWFLDFFLFIDFFAIESLMLHVRNRLCFDPCDKSFVIKPAFFLRRVQIPGYPFPQLDVASPTFSTVLCTIFVWYIDSVMPKIRPSIFSEHLRRRVKVSSTVANHSSSTLSLPSITTSTKQFYGSNDAPNQSPISLQKHRYTQQRLLKPHVDRFNTRGRTIYNAFDCLSLEHQGHSSRLRLMNASHRRNAHGKRKALPKETLCLASPDAVMTRSHSFAGAETAAKCSEWILADIDPFKTEGSDEKLPSTDDGDILRQADRLFEMYIRMDPYESHMQRE